MQQLWLMWGTMALVLTFTAVYSSGGQPMQITSIKGG